jgi:hypothetical protein
VYDVTVVTVRRALLLLNDTAWDSPQPVETSLSLAAGDLIILKVLAIWTKFEYD